MVGGGWAVGVGNGDDIGQELRDGEAERRREGGIINLIACLNIIMQGNPVIS